MISPLLIATLTASLLGSPHCVGMCGPFVLLSSQETNRKNLWAQFCYHAGRLMSYVAAGAVAALAGATLNLGGDVVGLQQTAAFFAGGLMVAFGLFAVLKAWNVGFVHFQLPSRFQQTIQRLYQSSAQLPVVLRSGAIGLLSTLLPCGWLYVFILSAAGTASIWSGMALMAFFWIGTLPILTAFGLGTHFIPQHLRSVLPIVTAIFVVAVGVEMLMVRAFADFSVLQQSQQTAIERVESSESTSLPCCHGH